MNYFGGIDLGEIGRIKGINVGYQSMSQNAYFTLLTHTQSHHQTQRHAHKDTEDMAESQINVGFL